MDSEKSAKKMDIGIRVNLPIIRSLAMEQEK